jgi:hypothetical protein
VIVHGPVQIFFGDEELHPICVQSSQVPAPRTLKNRQNLIWRWLTAPPGPLEVIQNYFVSRPHIGEVFEGPREEFLVFLSPASLTQLPCDLSRHLPAQYGTGVKVFSTSDRVDGFRLIVSGVTIKRNFYLKQIWRLLGLTDNVKDQADFPHAVPEIIHLW